MDDYTLYDILGVAPTASVAEITRAYRRIVKNLHPDATGTAHTARLFSMVQHAREVLTDPIRRAAYDRDLANSGVRGSASGRAQRGARSSGRDTPRGPDSVEAATVAEAMRAFDAAVVAVPHIDMSELSAAVAKLKTHWAARGLAVSPRADIAGVLRANLERDSTYPGLSLFLVEVLTQDKCVQVQSVFADQSRTFAYRIWNPPGDSLALFGSAAETILDLGNPASTGARSDRPAPDGRSTTGKPVSPMTNLQNRLGQAFTPVVVLVAVLAIVAIGAVVLSQITGPTTTTIPLGEPANGLAITPDGRHAYVTHGDGVAVIDTASNTVTTTITIPYIADRVAITPDGRHAYITNGDRVAVIDTASNTVTTTITIPPDGQFPPVALELAIAPDGRHAYVAMGGYGQNDRILVIDTSSNSITSTIPLPNTIAPDTITVNGGHVYLVIYGKVVVVDTTSNTITSPFPVSYANGLAITPDGRHAYVTQSLGVSVIDTNSNSITTTITDLRFHWSGEPAITADGRHVYILDSHVNNVADNVTVVDTNSNRITSTIPLPDKFDPMQVAISPDGRHICIIGHRGSDNLSDNVLMIEVGE